MSPSQKHSPRAHNRKVPMALEELEGSNQPPPFLTKTYDLVDKPETDDMVSWGPNGTSFIVWKPMEFARDVLPKYFKHNNFSSFVRQLNTYGFRKVDPDRWEFANDNFIRNKLDLLKEIHRRKSSSPAVSGHHPPANSLVAASANAAAIEVGNYGGITEEIETLKRDKNLLMMELVRLRQQQQASDSQLRELKQRLDVTEQRQQTMFDIFTAALKNPGLLQRFFNSVNTSGVQRLEGRPARNGRKKRRARGSSSNVDDADLDADMDLDGVDDDSSIQGANQLVQYSGVPSTDLESADFILSELRNAPAPNETFDFTHAFDSLELGMQQPENLPLASPCVTIHEQSGPSTSSKHIAQGLASSSNGPLPIPFSAPQPSTSRALIASPKSNAFSSLVESLNPQLANGSILEQSLLEQRDDLAGQGSTSTSRTSAVGVLPPSPTLMRPSFGQLNDVGNDSVLPGMPIIQPITGNTGSPSLPIDVQPIVSSPSTQDLDLPQDLINSLQAMGSGDLAMPDTQFPDEMWNQFLAGVSSPVDFVPPVADLEMMTGLTKPGPC